MVLLGSVECLKQQEYALYVQLWRVSCYSVLTMLSSVSVSYSNY